MPKSRAPRRPRARARAARRPGPPGGRRATNRRARTQAIARAALRLYLARGLEAVAVDDVCAAAGVAKGSFYRYFADQEALVDHLVAPLAAGFAAVMDGCERALATAGATAELPAIYLALAAGLWQALPGQEPVVRLYLQEARSPAVGPRRPIARLAVAIERRAVRITEIARARGLLRELPPRIVALAVVGAVERLLHAALSDRRAALGPPAAIAGAVISVIVDGIRER